MMVMNLATLCCAALVWVRCSTNWPQSCQQSPALGLLSF